jgi:signal transduction histidine kinase
LPQRRALEDTHMRAGVQAHQQAGPVHTDGATRPEPWPQAALWLAGLLLALVPLLASLPIRMARLAQAGDLSARLQLGLELAIGLGYAGAAALLLWLRPRDPVLRFLALTLLSIGAVESSLTADLIDPARSRFAALWTPPVMLLRALEMSCGLSALYLYPDGRFTPRWTRPLAALWVTLNGLWLLWPTLPLNVLYGPTWRATPLASSVFALLWLLSGVAAQRARVVARRASQSSPSGAGLVSLGTLSAASGVLLYYSARLIPGLRDLPTPLFGLVTTAVLTLALLALPLCVLSAMVRYRLHDGERLVGRALGALALSLLIAAGYLGLVLGAASFLRQDQQLLLSALATVLITLSFAPLREVVQRQVSRWLYGERHAPLSALLALTTQLEQARTPLSALTSLADTAVQVLKLPYLAIELGPTELAGTEPGQTGPGRVAPPLIERGTPGGSTETFPLRADGETVGVLRIGTGAPLGREVHSLLRTVAQQAGAAAHNLHLAAQVQRSRERLVTAREEERRRLRRDLHDGLGPTLAAQTLKLGTARALLLRDSAALDALLVGLEHDVEHAIADIRRVVEDLRPPALDDLGLCSALQRAVQDLTGPGPAGTGALHCTLRLPDDLPPLGAAAEVAAYRIVVEAVSNVVRHAQARHCLIALSCGAGGLRVQVEDDGCGLPPIRRAGRSSGVGLWAMRERAEELGGRCEIGVSARGGVRVTATLPVHAAATL